MFIRFYFFVFFFFQAEDGIRDLVRSRGLGDVYKRQADGVAAMPEDRMIEYLDGLTGSTSLPYTHIAALDLSLIHI